MAPYTYASDVTIARGMFSFGAALKSPKTSEKETKLETACPTCPSKPATKLTTVYKCPTHGEVDRANVLKASKDAAGEMVVVGDDASVKAAKASELAKDVVELVEVFAVDVYLPSFAGAVKIAEGVESYTYPIGTPYVIQPKARSEFHEFLIRLIGPDGRWTSEDGKVCSFLANANVSRGGEKLFRVQTWEGNLVLQELIRPEELVHFDAPSVNVGDGDFDMIRNWLAEDARPFNVEEYKNQTKKRLVTFLEARKNPGGIIVDMTPKAPAPEQSVSGMADMIRKMQEAKAS